MRYVVIAATGIAVLAGGGLVALSRLNGLSTRADPSAPERVLAKAVRRWAVPRDARTAANPLAFSPDVWIEARAHFADHCASCHANNGSGETEIGPNFFPKVPDMRLPDTQALTDGEIYWIIKNGIRLTGMPAWGAPGADDHDTWRLVHLIRRLKDVTAEDLRAMEAINPRSLEELEEERQDDAFLAGETPVPSSVGHHHKKESP